MNKTKTVIVGIKTRLLDSLLTGFLKEVNVRLKKKTKLRVIK